MRVYCFSLLLCTAVFLGGCKAIDRPDYFASGRDERVFNPQTGRFEWPNGEPARKPHKPRVNLREGPSTGSGGRRGIDPGDGRTYNPQTGRYEWPTNGGTPLDRNSPVQ